MSEPNKKTNPFRGQKLLGQFTAFFGSLLALTGGFFWGMYGFSVADASFAAAPALPLGFLFLLFGSLCFGVVARSIGGKPAVVLGAISLVAGVLVAQYGGMPKFILIATDPYRLWLVGGPVMTLISLILPNRWFTSGLKGQDH